MKPLAKVRAVTFDVGGTLIEPWPSVGHVYAQVAREFGMNGLEPAALESAFARAWSGRADFDYSRAAWQQLVRETFAGAGGADPGAACFAAIYDRFAGAAAWRIHDDVRPALEALRRNGVRLGVISNWDERLRPLLASLELSDWFEVVVVSRELGRAKPAPEIFTHAARLFGLPPEAVLHVGDRPEEDLAGGRAAGFHAVLVDRRGGRGERGGERAAERDTEMALASLAEIAELLPRGAEGRR